MKRKYNELFWGCFVFLGGVVCIVALLPPPIPPEPIDQHAEAYKPKLYTVITREAIYENLKRAGSGEYETPEGKRIDFNEPYTEIEQ